MEFNHSKHDYEIPQSPSYILIILIILLTAFIALTAVIGNGAVIIIFHKKKMINGSNNYIIAFAVLDIFISTTMNPVIGFELIVGGLYYYEFRFEMWIVMNNFTILSNLGLLCAVAIDRRRAPHELFP